MQTEVTDALRQVTRYTHDSKTSARLLNAALERNRQQTLEWCVELTIDQLVSDRQR
jgi:hypothetical protein